MASGTNAPLSLAYRVVLYDNQFETCRINFAKQDGVWVKNLLEMWPFLKYDNAIKIDVKNNVYNCLHNRLKNCIEAMKLGRCRD